MSINKFQYDKGNIKVNKLDIEWDLYWAMADKDPAWAERLNHANEVLTTAAISALQQRKPKIWHTVSNIYADLGAADSEPRWQFADLWAQAYGEDIY